MFSDSSDSKVFTCDVFNNSNLLKNVISIFSAELCIQMKNLITKQKFINLHLITKNNYNYWYTYEDIVTGLISVNLSRQQLNLPPQQLEVLEVVGSQAQLQIVLDNLPSTRSQPIVIIMNVDASTGNFTNNNHWVALVIDKDNRAIYIDPRGQQIGDDIRKALSAKPVVNGIQQLFDQMHRPQTNGNNVDCGPFVVEAVSQILNGSNIVAIQTAMNRTNDQASLAYGQQLRARQRNPRPQMQPSAENDSVSPKPFN